MNSMRVVNRSYHLKRFPLILLTFMFSNLTVSRVAFQWAGKNLGDLAVLLGTAKNARWVCKKRPDFTKQKYTLVNISKASYPLLRVEGPFCALSWVHHRSTAHSIYPGLWSGVGFGTTPGEAGTPCTVTRNRWHRSHTNTGIYSWAWSSAHYGRSHHHAHSLSPTYLVSQRGTTGSHILYHRDIHGKMQLLGSFINVLVFID